MINKKILNFKVFSIIFSLILGILLHFTYRWSNENLFVATVSSINESTWEHLKLLFFPMLITTIIGYFYLGKHISNFLCAKTVGIISAISFTIVFFYTYTGILGTNLAVLNIFTFFASVILGEYVAYRLMLSHFLCSRTFSIIILIALLLCFVIFTFFTPNIELFRDPVNNVYGIAVF